MGHGLPGPWTLPILCAGLWGQEKIKEKSMKSRKLTQLVAVTSLVVSSSAAMAGEWMTGEQIEKLIKGNTTYGKHQF